MKIIYVNCGVNNYLKEDRRSDLPSNNDDLPSNNALPWDPAVHTYDFHIFIISSSYFHGFITNQFNDLLPVGLSA